MFQQWVSPILWCGLIAGAIAQAIKVPLDYLQTRVWHWNLILEPGGMPSSHSAFIVGVSHGIGLFVGFNTPLYALGFAVTAIVVYDATGIRRQAGIHAELINMIIRDLASGHPSRIKDLQLKEVLGHTPLEAIAGVLLGLAVAQSIWLLWA